MAATMHALIYPDAPGVIVERRMIDLATVPDHKKAWWRPVVTVGDTEFNRLTQKKTGPVTTIEQAQVLDTYTVSDLTPEELDANKANAVVNELSSGTGYAVLFRALFNIHNRVLVLEGKPTVTPEQFRTALKALL